MNRHDDFLSLRQQYPIFKYNSYEIRAEVNEISISFDFSIDKLAHFKPQIKIKTENLSILNSPNSHMAEKIIFYLGMVEALSYWKAACPPVFHVACGSLEDEELLFWKKLYYNGLGEFFYINEIKTNIDDFLSITQEPLGPPSEEGHSFISSNKNIIPIGGGKDSAVTTELLKSFYDENLFFTINEQEARRQTVIAGGYPEERIIKTTRTICPELLRLNKEGFLNGHTPFSAIVAFLSLYCAYITGAKQIVLSNESSANEPSVAGSDINHQYSKSFEFEKDFQDYTKKHVGCGIHYFSLLRPFSEFHIGKMFASMTQYHPVFRSCNVGSKTNTWCCNCGKCLFVYSILSPFLEEKKLLTIFGENLFEKEGLIEEFKGLIGINHLKPFECVGTVDEINYALSLTIDAYQNKNIALPFLLNFFNINRDVKCILSSHHSFLLYNKENSIPEKFLNTAKEMFEFVTGDN